MDDAEVDPGDQPRTEVFGRHRDLGRDIEAEPSRLGDEGERVERLNRVGDRPTRTHPQLGSALGDTEADTGPVDCKATLPKAHRYEAPLAPWEPGPYTHPLALGCLEEGSGVVLQDRLGALPRQLPEACARELPAQGREVGHLRTVPLTELAVAVDHPRPGVPGGAQQAEAPAALGRRGPQGDPGGAVNRASRTHVRKDSERCRQKTGRFETGRRKFEREATLLISKIWRAKSTDCY
jgi:hypothetical protein